jgi:hypothetical protein
LTKRSLKAWTFCGGWKYDDAFSASLDSVAGPRAKD